MMVTRTPNKGGKPQYLVSYPGQVTHRKRRGKLVEIPPEWRGHTLHEETKRKRQSKQPRKLRRRRFPKPGER